MKKVLVSLVLVSALFVSGCTKVEEKAKGDYKEGTYFSAIEDNYGGASNSVSALVTVDESGKIASVFIDSTYTKDNKVTTKKALGDAYGMKATSANIGKIEGGAEWYEQIKTLETKIVEKQGLEWLVWSDSEQTTTDSVAGVTIKVNAYYSAVKSALDKAK